MYDFGSMLRLFDYQYYELLIPVTLTLRKEEKMVKQSPIAILSRSTKKTPFYSIRSDQLTLDFLKSTDSLRRIFLHLKSNQIILEMIYCVNLLIRNFTKMTKQIEKKKTAKIVFNFVFHFE